MSFYQYTFQNPRYIDLFSFLVAFSQASWLPLTLIHQSRLIFLAFLSTWCQVSVIFVLHFSLSFKILILVVIDFYLYLYLFSLNWLLGSSINYCVLFYLTYCDWLFVILRYTLILNDYFLCNCFVSFGFYIKKIYLLSFS